MDGVCDLLKVLVHQINPRMSDEEVAALVQAAQNSPLDASSSRLRNTLYSSKSTHIPSKDDVNTNKKKKEKWSLPCCYCNWLNMLVLVVEFSAYIM
ncbi:hypothetical protein Ahy_B07g086954 isoform B [Arachis hypogaea]|uniref:Uncharacterized protein n=1 Tax=Arachis hypogaea TaxID=3818 RepID=A0A444YAW9_ARAHY|nr:hypothetical protein Ahy_B07g086954 isoform B [Arachis hypogaea]